MINFLRNFVPHSIWKKVRQFAWAYTQWTSYTSYSGEGEDMILRKIFYKKEKGFYIDIGAYHPKKSSNTYFFYKKGWSGINIDAMPGSMKLFNQVRKRDINLEIPIGEDDATVNYYEFEDKALNGFESDTLKIKDQSKPQNALIKIHKLKSHSLNSIMKNYLPNGKKIDFMTIDVEGQEMLILQSIDFSKYNPSWLLIEIWNFDLLNSNSNQIVNFLFEKGFSVKAKTLNTVFFSREG